MIEQKNTPSRQLGAKVESSEQPFSGSHFSTNGASGQPGIEDIMRAGIVTLDETAPVFQPLTLADLLKLPPKQWLLDLVFGAGDLVMLYGPPGTGKTFVAIDMIFSLLRSRERKQI